MADVDGLEQLSQQQHQRFYELFGASPARGDGFAEISASGRQLSEQVKDVRAEVINSGFSTAVVPALASATSEDHHPFDVHARVAATAARVSDASAQVNVRGAAAVSANSANEASQVAAIPDRDSPEGALAALNAISTNQAQSLDVVEQSAATEQQLGHQAARGDRDGPPKKRAASRPVNSATNTGGSSGGVQSAPYRGGGHVFAADNGGGAQGGESGETDEKGYGGSASKGKGGTTPIHPHGDEEHHWGHPTDPHEWHPSGEPDYPHSGTFDDGHGSWEWSGPGRQGGAEGTQTHEGIGGTSKIDGWIAKGDTKWSGDVFGHQLDLSADGEFGAHAGADGAATQHGVSGQLDAFAGIEAGTKGTYHLGPVDLSMGAAGQMGYGGNAGFDFGMADDGKFVMGGSLGAAWGLGGKLSPKIAVDPKAVEGWVDKAGEWLGGLFK